MSDQQLQKAFETERNTIKKTIQQGEIPAAIFDAINAHHKRTDEANTSIEAYSNVTTSCKKGCDFCCHFKVEAGPEEIFLIVDYIVKHFDQAELDTVLETAQANQNIISDLTQEKRIKTNLACALLRNGKCSVYSVRPSACRKMHSLDVETCKSSFDKPEDTTIQNSEVPLIASVLLSIGSAARQGLNDVGLDSNLYDLNEVLYDALKDSKYQKRWKNGKKAFV